MKKFKTVILTEAILSFGLALLTYYVIGPSNPMYLLSCPFDLIGKGLRLLSLSSAAGNVAAVILYAAVSLLPVIYLIAIRRNNGLGSIDLLLLIISGYSFYMFYQFINPGLMLQRLPKLFADESALPMIKLTFALVFYTLVVGYLLIRLSRHLTRKAGEDRFQFLCQRLQRILMIVSILYVFLFEYFTTFQMLSSLDRYASQKASSLNMFSGPDGYAGMKDNSFINIFYVVLNYILEGLPVIFAILVLASGIRLLQTMTANHLKEEEVQAAANLGQISRYTVYVSVISNIAINAFQFLFSKLLTDTDYTLKLSFIPLILAFSAMILSAYFNEAKEINDDNEMII